MASDGHTGLGAPGTGGGAACARALCSRESPVTLGSVGPGWQAGGVHAADRDPEAGTTMLAGFSAATRAWFLGNFPAPTPAQSGAWEAISAGRHTLVVAPTGSGKTLSAFLWAIDRLATEPPPAVMRRCRVVYVSPLKALAVDVQKNLRAPLLGIGHAADRLQRHHHRGILRQR